MPFGVFLPPVAGHNESCLLPLVNVSNAFRRFPSPRYENNWLLVDGAGVRLQCLSAFSFPPFRGV